MALTRKGLKAMGLTDEQVDSVIELHTETINGLTTQRDEYKVAADKLPGTAVRKYFESKGITGKGLEIAMRGAGAEIDAAELDGEKLKDTAALDALVTGDFAGLVGKIINKGAGVETPPDGGEENDFSKMTDAEYFAYQRGLKKG